MQKRIGWRRRIKSQSKGEKEGRKEGLSDYSFSLVIFLLSLHICSLRLLSYSGTFWDVKTSQKIGVGLVLIFMKNLGFRVYNQNGFSSGSSFLSIQKWNFRSGSDSILWKKTHNYVSVRVFGNRPSSILVPVSELGLGLVPVPRNQTQFQFSFIRNVTNGSNWPNWVIAQQHW